MEMMFEPGDIQLINNHVIYHARTAYEDAPEGARCLKRIWLSMPNSRALPRTSRFSGAISMRALRGGIVQAP